MRGVGGNWYEYLLEYRAEQDFPVGFDGDASVIVRGYHRYPDKAFCVSRM
jgi:hypothetical protein